MGTIKKTGDASDTSSEALEQRLRDEGMEPRWWGNAPGDTYGRHDHPYHKVIFCQRGSIVFHTDDGDVEIVAGDRLEIEPRTAHAATVGGDGVSCVEGGG